MSDDGKNDRVIVNKAELARLLDCALPTVGDLIDRYPDFPILRRGSTGVEWQFDAELVTEFLRDRREAEQQAAQTRRTLFDQLRLPLDGEPDPGVITPAQRVALARAVMIERQNAIEAGTLLRVSEVREAQLVSYKHLARFLDGLPAQLGRQFNLPQHVVGAMKAALDEARRNLVRDLGKLLRDSAEGGEQP